MIQKQSKKRDELRGMSIMCDAIMILGERYAKLAREMAEKKKQIQLVKKNCYRLRQTVM